MTPKLFETFCSMPSWLSYCRLVDDPLCWSSVCLLSIRCERRLIDIRCRIQTYQAIPYSFHVGRHPGDKLRHTTALIVVGHDSYVLSPEIIPPNKEMRWNHLLTWLVKFVQRVLHHLCPFSHKLLRVIRFAINRAQMARKSAQGCKKQRSFLHLVQKK